MNFIVRGREISSGIYTRTILPDSHPLKTIYRVTGYTRTLAR